MKVNSQLMALNGRNFVCSISLYVEEYGKKPISQFIDNIKKYERFYNGFHIIITNQKRHLRICID